MKPLVRTCGRVLEPDTFLTMEAVKYLVAHRKQARAAAEKTSNTELRVLEISLGQDRRGADALAECDQLALDSGGRLESTGWPKICWEIRYSYRSGTGRSCPTVDRS